MFIDLPQILELRKAWKNSFFENNIFINNYLQLIKNIEIGGTFIPENLAYEGLTDIEIIAALQYLVVDLNIKHLRIGLRLDKIDLNKGDIGLYKKILKYCFDNNIKLILNLGPIKYCGWPEYHLSETIKNNTNTLPKIKSVINSNSEISLVSRAELEKLLILLTTLYSASELKNVITLQAENESFNAFGKYKWVFSEDHLTEIIHLFDIYFPRRSILVNSAGLFDTNSIINFIKKRSDSKRFTLGLNYYYDFDKFRNLKFYRWLDLYVFSWKLKNFNLSFIKKMQTKYCFKTEITEAQMEPWGRANDPGNSIQSLKFVILRSAIFLKQNNGYIGLYGLDRLAMKAIRKNLNHEHLEMIDLIKKIQNK